MSCIPLIEDLTTESIPSGSTILVEFVGASSEGIVDFKLDETTDPAQNLFRIRNLRNVEFDGRWHKLKVAKNFEVSLVK